ncbi:FHA domain-containing protein [Microbacterium trichothecenolyticum]|uniref:FHA domain-containing protein n=1 Tax=Microbacterium trichothecenolyticum TaxID=69370 RepID=A0ABU0TXA4_MICTR|nr:FHA domain-containing protein [Microbacterium trichothecenolyticum]MDQ1123589.1 hypothetical protein [Microbacterium trichothecenolyticum]
MDAGSLTAMAVGTVLVVALALHVWYAIGLSRVFAARGAETWRAWVPLVNDAEVFRLGRIDPVRAVLLIVPLVNVYGLVLKATAAHRLAVATGRGAGTTALALVLPPVWAGILATASAHPDAVDAAVSHDAPREDSSDPSPREASVSGAAPSGPISSIPGAASGEGAAAAAGSRRAARSVEAPSIVVTLAGPAEVASPAGGAGLTQEGAAAIEAAPVVETTDAADPTAASRTGTAEVPVSAAVDESTQTARPRTRRRGEWKLGLPDGQRVAVTGRAVVLGRRPPVQDDGVQYIAVADDTRTVSKQHARLDWAVTGWTITDLGSTNGVTLLHDDGRAERVRADAPTLATPRFRLGDAELELLPAGSA